MSCDFKRVGRDFELSNTRIVWATYTVQFDQDDDGFIYAAPDMDSIQTDEPLSSEEMDELRSEISREPYRFRR